MYEYINGTLAEIAPAYAVVDAGGVGYFINISLKTFTDIEHSEQARLFTHFIVREDVQSLFGFSSKIERELFRRLISVSGVGGNTARMILSTYSTSELRNIISTANAVLLKNVKGLGLKTAQKIIVELSGKMVDLGLEAKAVKSAGEVDNEVLISSKEKLTVGEFYNVAISDADEYDLYGKVVN